MGAEKNMLANGALAVYVSQGNGYSIYLQNQAKFGTQALKIAVDFSKSSNLQLVGQGGMRVSATVAPGQCIQAAELVPQTTLRGNRLQWTASWQGATVDPVDKMQELSSRLELVTKRIHAMQAVEKRLTAACDAAELRRALATAAPGTKYVDTSFPPCGRSVGMPESKSRTTWRRPEEFMPADAPPAQVFHEDIEA